MEERKIIKDYILHDIIKNNDKSSLSDDEKLISGGIIDSVEIMKLLSFVEEKFNIEISPEELVMENFETVDAISGLVEKKVSK